MSTNHYDPMSMPAGVGHGSASDYAGMGMQNPSQVMGGIIMPEVAHRTQPFQVSPVLTLLTVSMAASHYRVSCNDLGDHLLPLP